VDFFVAAKFLKNYKKKKGGGGGEGPTTLYYQPTNQRDMDNTYLDSP
jgi:hypothetical protein